MKTLTLCVLENNSNNIEKFIDSCLIVKEDIEILIVGKTSVDEKLERYVTSFPEEVRIVIPDATHSNPLANGINAAKGLYFKVVDVEHQIDIPTLVKVIQTLKDLMRVQSNLDMMVCDYEYPKKKDKRNKVQYDNIFPLDKVIQWHQTKVFKELQYFCLESILIKTNILKNMKWEGMHSDYETQILILQVLPRIRSMYYLNQTLEYLKETDKIDITIDTLDIFIEMIQYVVTSIDVSSIESRKLRNCIIHHIHTLLLFLGVYCERFNSVEIIKRKEELMEYIKIKNPYIYKQLSKAFTSKLYTSHVKIARKLLYVNYRNKK